MKGIKKPVDMFDVVITMTSEEAKIIKHVIGKKSRKDNEEYYENKDIHSVFSDLYYAIERAGVE